MARDLPVDVLNGVTSDSLSPVILLKLILDSGDINLWNGIGEIVFSGDTYTGAGDLLGLTGIEETQILKAAGLQIRLTGLDSSIISVSLNENYQERLAKLWFGVVITENTLATEAAEPITTEGGDILLIEQPMWFPEPYLLFVGRMDVMEIEEQGGTAIFTINVENRLIDLERANVRRYTPEDQHIDYPNDKGLDFIASLQDLEIVWGKG